MRFIFSIVSQLRHISTSTKIPKNERTPNGCPFSGYSIFFPAFSWQTPWVIVPMGQKAHQVRGL